MKLNKYIYLGAGALALTLGACSGDLNQHPSDPNVKTELTSQSEWLGFFASLYGSFLYGGNLSTSDTGAGTFTRCHWNLQEITADEAIISNKWNDPGYTVLKFNTWLNDNEWVYAAFSREFYTAKMCSEFIAQADGAIEYLGEDEVEAMKAEARVIRAYAYMWMIDNFGRGPWITENSVTGATPPTYDRQQLFDGVVADLVATINGGHLRKAANQVYGRLSEEAARCVLAKLYLNANVYVGTPMYAECAAQCQEIVKTLNTLCPTYKYLFCESNDKYVGNGEIIWAVPQEVGSYETWGGTTYLTAGCYVETVDPKELVRLGAGKLTDSGEFDGYSVWSGVRVRPELSSAFEAGDERNLMYVGQFNIGVENLDDYGIDSDGYMCVKYTYTTEDDYDNTANLGRSSQICNADYPLFRLADVYLMLAECEYAGGVSCDGLAYLNKVRERAGLKAAPALSADVILHERQCELYFEGWRRSDLIRFGRYTGSTYLWSWKGGVYEGANIADYRSLFAIPYQYVATVGQNPGY
ncbi:MAG: RagB/SusD family nutrient uptake outer membrane protein [Bacteroidales bacterium]|nr:RagB/SusD family nutrient uptake outer membrane protein [Bacteroidales bacterium]